MRSAIWSGFLAAIVCAVTVGLVAQQPPSSPASQAGKTVTFSGCIEKAPAEAGASAATATPAFILANAAPAGSASSSPSGTVGTSGGAKPAAKYRLDADAAKLTPHVGHKVEITGTVDEMSSSATSPHRAARPLQVQVRRLQSSRSIPSRWSRRPARSVVITTVWCAGAGSRAPTFPRHIQPSSVTPPDLTRPRQYRTALVRCHTDDEVAITRCTILEADMRCWRGFTIGTAVAKRALIRDAHAP